MSGGWQEASSGSSVLAIERRIAAIARRQQELITGRQLAALGLRPSTVRSRVAVGRLFRIRRGIFSITAPPFTERQLWLGAVLACGPEATLSHEPSAALQGFLSRSPSGPEVTVPDGRARSRAGIVVHRSRIDPRDRRRVHGVPCTSADRTLIDLAPSRDLRELEVLLVAAESLGLLKRSRLAELVSERTGRPGIRRLAALLEEQPAIARSWAEVHFLPVCFLAGIPHPSLNHPVTVPGRSRPLVVDFAWPEVAMAVELDSQRFHGDWASAVRDRERDQTLALAGWLCHRFVRSAIEADPVATADRLRALHSMRIGLPHGGSDRATGAAGA
ncbi:MAG: type IV toxin-antitoxin system AbiEi family antitoxin domain-containing protein [Solirubrobacterales bacterium]|nr:type IV toxin-antitoxin system AbiEi family antitoxin domain-containing protein [Solirubrobacterales bacterium]